MYLKISSKNDKETKIIDSIGYAKMLKSKLLIIEETKKFKQKLEKIGFIEYSEIETLALNDSLTEVQFDLKKQLKKCTLYIGTKNSENLEFNSLKRESLNMAFNKIEFFINERKNQLEKDGFSQSKIKLSNLKISNDTLFAELDITLNQKRKIDGIEIIGLAKFPKGHLKNLERSYKTRLFSKEAVENIKKEVDQYEFVKQIKYPEILFTKDSTKVFLYVEKKESNTFDGFIGFGNDDVSRKIKINGFLDINLSNIIKSGEKIGLLWKSDGKDQKTLAVGLEIPFLFKTPFGLKTQLNIFRQDSLFQNTKTGIEIGYNISSKSNIFIGYQSETSSVIQNSNIEAFGDFENKFFTTSFDMKSISKQQSFLNEKNSINLKIGYGDRKTNLKTEAQFFTGINLKKNFQVNSKNNIEIRNQNYLLQSNKLIKNEMLRFGGFNSIRGFAENSLQGNFLTAILTEYQYQLASTLILNTITDYAYYEDKSTKLTKKILGIGFGLKILTKNGLMNIQYANGSTNNQAVKLSNSIIHISLKSEF